MNEKKNNNSIGIATMRQDKTIILQLRAAGENQELTGDGYFEYPPEHKQYEMIIAHLGKIKPGETKPVPPWD